MDTTMIAYTKKADKSGSRARVVTEEQERTITDFLHYDPLTGSIIWTVKRKRGEPGNEAGAISLNGYRRISINKVMFLAHRIAWFLHHGKWPKAQIDHINGIKTDNRLANLREATQTENSQAFKSKQKNASSRFRGVTWKKEERTWRANIMCNTKLHRLGSFRSEELAAQAYNNAAIRLGFKNEALNKI